MSAPPKNRSARAVIAPAVLQAFKRHVFEDVTLNDLMAEPELKGFTPDQVKKGIYGLQQRGNVPIRNVMRGQVWRYVPSAPSGTSGIAPDHPGHRVPPASPVLGPLPGEDPVRWASRTAAERSRPTEQSPVDDRHVDLKTMGAVIKLVHSIRPGELVLLYREEDGRLCADRDPEA